MRALCWLGSSAAPGSRMPSSRPGALTRLGTLGLVIGPGPSSIASLGSAVLWRFDWAVGHRRSPSSTVWDEYPRKEGICGPSVLIWP